MSLPLSLLTMALTLGLIALALVKTATIARAHYTYSSHALENIAGFSPLFLGLALMAAMPVGLETNVIAYVIGGDWDSPYVLHFPTAEDFWLRFVPYHLATRSDTILSDYRLAFDVVALGWAGLALRSLIKGAKERGAVSWARILPWVLAYAAVYFVAIETLLYLFAHVLGSVMLLGNYWFVPLILMFFAAAGGSTKIYDSSGKHIGEIRRY